MRSVRAAFTLVELLVVIAVLGMLMALLLPALGATKENARQVQCRNNLAQLGKGCLAHTTTHGFFPTGGWGWRWSGDPDRGYRARQPGGWIYNVLPYMGEAELHDLGKGKPAAEKARLGAQRAARPLPLLCCPSRRRPESYPFSHNKPYNIDAPSAVGRNDYAANAGDIPYCQGATGITGKLGMSGPASESEGDSRPEADWAKIGTCVDGKYPTGLIYVHSEVKTVPDGESCTYLLGEKCLRSSTYSGSTDYDNNQGWDMGYDVEINRWTDKAPAKDYESEKPTAAQQEVFGGPHDAKWFAVFCDGHVRGIPFDVDPVIHAQLGNRKNGAPTKVSEFE